MVEEGPAVVKGLGPDGLTWTIDASAARAGEIQPGKIVFLTSRVVGRVLGVTRQAGTLAVVLGPVEITDVIKEGTFSVQSSPSISRRPSSTRRRTRPARRRRPSRWRTSTGPAAPDRGRCWRPTPPTPVAVACCHREGSCRLPRSSTASPRAGYLPVQAPREVTILRFKCFPVIGSDGIGVHLSTDSGGIRMSGDVRLRLANPSLDFDLDIKGGKVRTALVKLSGAAGLLMKFEAGSEKGFQANVNERIVLPVDFSLPDHRDARAVRRHRAAAVHHQDRVQRHDGPEGDRRLHVLRRRSPPATRTASSTSAGRRDSRPSRACSSRRAACRSRRSGSS